MTIRLSVFLSILLGAVLTVRAETPAEHNAALTAAARAANQKAEPVAPGKFQPTWESLSQYQFPEWFRDAKFGIWAHWGPQCEPEKGDWYARNMYFQLNKKGQPNDVYAYHLAHYGHPSVFGFKDIIPLWKAENWDPSKLMALYKKAGAKYFMALANHHDNFDTWDSKYQPWNAVNFGPKKDLIAAGPGLRKSRDCVSESASMPPGPGMEQRNPLRRQGRPEGRCAIRWASNRRGRQGVVVGRVGPAGRPLRAEPWPEGPGEPTTSASSSTARWT